jgi:hypothetical protein
MSDLTREVHVLDLRVSPGRVDLVREFIRSLPVGTPFVLAVSSSEPGSTAVRFKAITPKEKP